MISLLLRTVLGISVIAIGSYVLTRMREVLKFVLEELFSGLGVTFGINQTRIGRIWLMDVVWRSPVPELGDCYIVGRFCHANLGLTAIRGKE